MRVLIVSDTHRHNFNLYDVVKKEIKAGLYSIVHAGDAEGAEYEIETTTGLPCFTVCGNNDYGSSLLSDMVIMLGKHRVLLTHGHEHGVSYSLNNLKNYARGLDCDIVIFGHTHIPMIEREDDITFINPGSLTYPRQGNKCPSYIIATINENEDVDFEIKYLDKPVKSAFFF